MSDKLRTKDIKVSFSVNGKSEVVTLTRSLGDLDKQTDGLSKSLGASDVKITDVTKSQKELNAIVRASITETNKQNRVISQISSEYALASSMIGKTANEQQELNAVSRLGVNATKEQITQVKNLVRAHQAQVIANTKTQGSFRGLRGQAQNLGWQMQDVAVQMQMGTDKMVIFSQQGSQLASGFGPWGAVAGAVIAVTGALAGVIMKSMTGKASLKELEVAQKAVNVVFEEGAKKSETLNDKYRELFATNKQLAVLQLEKAISGTKLQRDAAHKAAKEAMKDNFIVYEQKKKILNEESMRYVETEKLSNATEKAYKKLADSYSIPVSTLKSLNRAIRENDTEQQAQILSTKRGNPLFREKSLLLLEQIESTKKLSRTERELRKIRDIGLPPEEDKEKTGRAVDSFKAEYNRTLAYSRKNTETILDEYNRRFKAAKKNYAKEGADQKKAAIYFKGLELWKTTKLKEESDKRLKIFNDQLNAEITAEADAQAKKIKAIEDGIQAEIDADFAAQAKRNTALIKIEKGQQKTKSPAAIEAKLFKDNSAELARQLEIAQREKHYREIVRINGLIEKEVVRHKDVNDQIAYAGVQAQLQAGGAFLSGMSNVMNQLTSISQEGSKEAEALFYASQAIAIATTIVNTEQAALAAANNAAGLTGLAGFLASASMVRAMGYASVGIIAGTTIAGAFDSGGIIPQGQYGVVSEYGDELVDGVLVKGKTGGTRVTSRSETNNIMNGGNNNSSGGSTINIYQTITGNGDKALAQAASKAAESGAKKGYAMVANDFSTGRGIRKTLKKSIGG